jgi:hypothetical protein
MFGEVPETFDRPAAGATDNGEGGVPEPFQTV